MHLITAVAFRGTPEPDTSRSRRRSRPSLICGADRIPAVSIGHCRRRGRHAGGDNRRARPATDRVWATHPSTAWRRVAVHAADPRPMVRAPRRADRARGPGRRSSGLRVGSNRGLDHCARTRDAAPAATSVRGVGVARVCHLSSNAHDAVCALGPEALVSNRFRLLCATRARLPRMIGGRRSSAPVSPWATCNAICSVGQRGQGAAGIKRRRPSVDRSPCLGLTGPIETLTGTG